MSTITSTHWVIGNRNIRSRNGELTYGRTVYLNRLHFRSVAKSRNIVDARSFKTEEEAREILNQIQPFYMGKWFLLEVTRDKEVLNENGLPYLRRFKVIQEVA